MPTMNALRPLLIDELRDLLDAEKQLTRALPKMARAAAAAPLRTAFEQHLRQTEGHVTRLERALEALDATVRGKPCAGMKGLVAEGQEMMSELKDDPVRDAALIVSAQKVEHYEIAAYGSCKAFAELLGESEVARWMAETLAEEKATDEKLTALAEGQVNPKATVASAEPRTESSDGIFARAAEWIRGTVETEPGLAARSRGGRRKATARGSRAASAPRRATSARKK
jgi:ferritin-like metal-binding protein YciE